MLLADTCRELYPAEERLCFMENTDFLSQEHSLGCKHPWPVWRIGTGSFLHIRSCSQVWTPVLGPGRLDKECSAGMAVD